MVRVLARGRWRLNRQILITGGAGFIGSHLADLLLREGDRVRVLDNLSPQVHGDEGFRPAYLDPEVELQRGDLRDPEAVRRALRGVDAVFHLAARVGVGQSMYEVAEYTAVNDLGTAVLLEALIERPVERLVVASSMSIYGEGLYLDSAGGLHPGVERGRAQLEAGDWEVRGAGGEVLEPIGTPETKAPRSPGPNPKRRLASRTSPAMKAPSGSSGWRSRGRTSAEQGSGSWISRPGRRRS